MNEHGWVGQLALFSAIQSELALLLNQLPFFNGRPIPTPPAASYVIELQQVLDCTAQIIGSADDMQNLLVSDASESHAFRLPGGRDIPFSCRFSFPR